MSKRFLITLAIVILSFGGIVWLTRDKAAAPTNPNAQPTSHFYGDNAKGVVLIEYGDYQCPACKAYHPVVKELVETHKADIHFQFRNFPLSAIHQNAFAGARAAEAADKQNKFWEMHDLLYEQQDSWISQNSVQSVLEGYAGQLGMNVEKFKQDYSSDNVNDLINADIKEAHNIGANSTPTFVLDGKKIDENPKDKASFDKLITDAIASKTQ